MRTPRTHSYTHRTTTSTTSSTTVKGIHCQTIDVPGHCSFPVPIFGLCVSRIKATAPLSASEYRIFLLSYLCLYFTYLLMFVYRCSAICSPCRFVTVIAPICRAQTKKAWAMQKKTSTETEQLARERREKNGGERTKQGKKESRNATEYLQETRVESAEWNNEGAPRSKLQLKRLFNTDPSFNISHPLHASPFRAAACLRRSLGTPPCPSPTSCYPTTYGIGVRRKPRHPHRHSNRRCPNVLPSGGVQ